MAKYLRGNVAIVAVLIGGIASAQVVAEGKEEQLKERRPAIEASFTIAGYSKYVWRGFTFVDEPVIQPCVTVAYKGLAATVFANYTTNAKNNYLTPERAKNRWTEVDLLLDYTKEVGGVTLGGGYYYYSQPNTGYKKSQEAYVAVTFDKVLFTPRLAVYTGLDEYEGYYASLSGKHSISTKLKKAGSVEISASLGYGDAGHNEWMYGVRRTGFADALAIVSLPIEVGNGWTVTPSLSHSEMLDKKLLPSSERRKTWVGLAFSFAF